MPVSLFYTSASLFLLCRWDNWTIFLDSTVIQFSHSVVSDSLQTNGLQHARLPCPSPTPRTCSNFKLMSIELVMPSKHLILCCPLLLLPSVFPRSGSFPVSQLFTSGGQSIRVSASPSVLPMNIQDWFPLGWTGWISLQSKGLSRVFSNTTVQKHQFFGTVVKNLPANASDVGLITNPRRSPGGRHGNLLQYSCLGNPVDRRAWQAIVHGV